MRASLSVVVVLAAALIACGGGGGGGGPPASADLLATGQAGGVTVELLAVGGLREGQTAARVCLTAGGTPVAGAALTVAARPAAGGPPAVVVLEPREEAAGVHALELVFPAAGEGWTVSVEVSRAGADPASVELPGLQVAATGRAAWVGDVLVTLGFDRSPAVGENPVTVTLHRLTAGALAPVDDGVVRLDPEMPSMGHGAPPGVAPTLATPGRYRGTVNFTMRGDWVVTATVSEAGTALGSAALPVSF